MRRALRLSLLVCCLSPFGCDDGDADPKSDSGADAPAVDAEHDAFATDSALDGAIDSAGSCGDGTCTPGESCSTCPGDCGRCPPDSCGNGTCDSGEACDTCASDCGACPGCGDGTCADSETCGGCAADCGACPDPCGDGTCGAGESCSLCPSDCGSCGDHAWSYAGVPYPTDPQPLGAASFGWDPSAESPDSTLTWDVGGSPPSVGCGDVVAMTGTRASDFEFDFSGCDDDPIWFVGDATFQGSVGVTGSNLVIDGPTFRGSGGALGLAGEMIAVRNITVIDPAEGWGSALYVAGRNIVVYQSRIGPSGDYTLATEVDHHCVKIGPGTDMWFIDSEFAECQGDGIQVGDESRNVKTDIQRVYVAGSSAHDNLQTGFWVKRAMDVVFSHNQIYNHTDGMFSTPVGSGAQNNHSWVTWIGNEIYDNGGGIQIQSTEGDAGPRFFIGNVVRNCMGDPGTNPHLPHAITTRGAGDEEYVMFNTIMGCPGGVSSPNPANKTVFGNLIDEGARLQINSPDGGGGMFDYNFYVGTPAIQFNGTNHSSLPFAGHETHGLSAGDARVDASFMPDADSPLVDAAGSTHAMFAMWAARYGLDITEGRPSGGAWDIGARERP